MCRYAVKGKAGYCSGFRVVPKSELQLLRAVATVGPISVGINAKLTSFHKYRSGETHTVNVFNVFKCVCECLEDYMDPLCDFRVFVCV